MFNRILCAAAVALTLAPVPQALADETMSAQQILRLFPGTFRAVVKGKFELQVIVTRDGTIVGVVPGLEDRGRWTVRKDQLCIVMPAMTRGRVECSEVVADGGWYRGRNVVFQKL